MFHDLIIEFQIFSAVFVETVDLNKKVIKSVKDQTSKTYLKFLFDLEA